MASSSPSENDKTKEKPKRYWNPGSYRNYVKTPSFVSNPKPVTSLKNTKVKAFYLISTAFKIAKIVAVVLIALILIGRF